LSTDKNTIYLDHAATSPMTGDLIEKHCNYLKEFGYNSNTVYEPGLKSKTQLEEIRKKFSENLRIDKNDLIFTSGGTESNNLAINCICGGKKSGGIIWYSSTSHPSLLNPVNNLSDQWSKIPIPLKKSGIIDIEKCADLEIPDVIALEWVNSEVGFIQPINQLKMFLKEKNIKCELIIDGVQGFGKIDLIDLKSVTTFTFTGHKCGSPVGIGGLYLKNSLKYKPMLLGGGQEREMRSGTVSVPLVSSFWDAFKTCDDKRKNFKDIQWRIDKPNLIQDEETSYSPYIMMLNTEPVEGEVLLHHLEEKGIYLGLGSACSASKKKISNTHKAIGLSNQQSRCTLRLSITPFNQQSEIDFVLQNISETWNSLNRFFK
jgi:cysteine desulfurase